MLKSALELPVLLIHFYLNHGNCFMKYLFLVHNSTDMVRFKLTIIAAVNSTPTHLTVLPATHKHYTCKNFLFSISTIKLDYLLY